MFEPNADVSPFNPIPPVVLLLSLTILGVEAVLQLGEAGYIGGPEAVGWRAETMRAIGFFDNIFEYMRETNTYDWNTLRRFFTHPFVNFSFVGSLLSGLMILALGKAVGDEFHPVSVLALFFISSALGAFALGFFKDVGYPVVGAFAGVYALLGAFSWMLWIKAGPSWREQLFAFRLALLLAVLQLIYHFAFGGGDDWIPKLVGFVSGFLLSFVLAPDGRARILGWLARARER